jgi:WD40 repeat protein
VVDQSPESGDEAGESGEDDAIEWDGGLINKNDPSKDPREVPKVVMAEGPWRKTIVAPSNIMPETDEAPQQELSLEYVHGYRSEDVRNSIKYNPMNEIVWHAGATGVIYNQIFHSQKFFPGHRYDIISLAITDDGKFVATGESCSTPRVRIWDANTGVEVAALPVVHLRGISALAFSRDGRFLASMGHDRHHTVAIYRTFSGLWWDATRVALEKTTETKVLFCLFCGEQNFPLMVGGIKIVSFLEVDGKSIRVKKGLFGKHKKIQPVLCGVYAYSQDVVVTGMVNGHLYFWKERKVCKHLPAHTGSVYAINQAELGIITGGKDGLVKIWDRDFACTRQFNMMDCDPIPYHVPVHSVCCNRTFTKICVGMRGGEIFEIAITSGKRVLVTEGHSKKQLHGLAANPANPDQYATIGDDGVLRVWSLAHKMVLRRLKLDGSSRALAWSHDGRTLAIGFGGSGGDVTVTSKDGAFMVLDESLEVLFEDRKAKMTVTDVKFSRGDDLLAVASEDGKVYVHERARNWALKATTGKASDEVRWVDWSADAEVLQAGTADADLALYSAADGSRIAAVLERRDAAWDTITCPFGWFVQGIYPRMDNEAFRVLSVDRSHKQDLLALSLVDGQLRMYVYPVQTIPTKKWVTGVGHGQRATKVRFSGDDKYIISLDGFGGAVFEYKLLSQTD